jgi:Tfp pilus assembly protein PilF
MKLCPAAICSLVLVVCFGLDGPILAQSPPEAELRFSTGVMHLREGRVDLALEEFKRAVEADAKNPYFQKGLGQAYAAKRDWGRAIAAFRKALELNPDYADAKNDLGYALIMSGNRTAGKQEFLSAFSHPMNFAPEVSAFNLGRAYLEEGNHAEAIEWFRTSLSRNKAYAAPYLMLAETLVAANRLDEAITQLEAGVREAPEHAELLLALGRAYFKAGRFADARPRLEAAAKTDAGGPIGRAATEQIKALPQ